MSGSSGNAIAQAAKNSGQPDHIGLLSIARMANMEATIA